MTCPSVSGKIIWPSNSSNCLLIDSNNVLRVFSLITMQVLEEFNSKEVYCIITNRFTVDEINTHRAETRRGTPSPMQGPVPSPLMPGPSPLQQM